MVKVRLVQTWRCRVTAERTCPSGVARLLDILSCSVDQCVLSRAVQTVVIDARGHMLGRLASILAKQLLNGQQVVGLLLTASISNSNSVPLRQQ